MKIREIMSEKVISIDRNRSLKDATELMQKHKISRLIVVKDKKLAGILTYKDMSKTLGSAKERVSSSHLHVSGSFTEELVTTNPDTDIKTAASLMLKHNISGIPLIEGGEIAGIVTKTDLIKTIKSKKPVRDIMLKPICVSPDDRIIHARKIMLDYDITVLPVVKEKLVGMVSRKELSIAMDNFRRHVQKRYQNARIENVLVSDIMKPGPKTATPKTTLEEAAKTMAENKVSGLPVEENDKLTGIITKTDLITTI